MLILFVFNFFFSVVEFSRSFLDVLEIERNGSVWLIDGGEYKEIDIPGHWVK